MAMVAGNHTSYLASDELSENSGHVETLRKCLIDIFQGRSDIEAVHISGILIQYTRDVVLPGLGAIRRNATANARTHMSPEEIVSATGLSHATVSRLITESRGTSIK